MAVTAGSPGGQRRVRRGLQIMELAILLILAAGIGLTASGAFAGGLASGMVRSAPPIGITDTPTATSTPDPCDPAWLVVSSPNVVGGNELLGVAAVSANDVWAVGFYGYCLDGELVEHWDGTSWSVVPIHDSCAPDANSNILNGVAAVSANDVWAVGFYLDGRFGGLRTLIEHWDGTEWSVVPSPNPGAGQNQLYGVAAVSANDVWATGFFDNGSGGPSLTLIEHWDGTQWSVVSSPNSGMNSNWLQAVAALSANNLWAVGIYVNDSSTVQTLIEHWDGAAWSVVSSPNVGMNDNHLNGVAVVSANDVWAVGSYDGSTLVEHWDGAVWSVVPSLNPNASNRLWGVTALSDSNVWAVGGTYQNIGGPYLTLIEHWDGTSWSLVSSPNPDTANGLNGVTAISANDVWAVGSHVTTGGIRTLVEHYTSPCMTPTNTPIPPTTTNTLITTNTPTTTPTLAGIINGHLTWQGVSAPNRPLVTGTLTLCVSGSSQSFSFSTDTSGNFTVTTGLPDGTYSWQTRGGRHISNASSGGGSNLLLIDGHATQEFGPQRGGDTNADNVVSSTDFTNLKNSFGQSGTRGADFDYNNVVTSSDFNILKVNFGIAGQNLVCP